eukprot:gnl/TRDRNA2_/TRDRNA2_30843_c0_seq1.p1 gnl/TRDRNA2_/TRDRNA2_30843_c0~~gnl/TRDRNA2_/TRDRNA2_30843_c0_seq1.p1  ORF type:complete len:214 (+),score=38.45 gnl/TRDRNA2_/TRDRNA2_30843_c0_seq1:115-756(+)
MLRISAAFLLVFVRENVAVFWEWFDKEPVPSPPPPPPAWALGQGVLEDVAENGTRLYRFPDDTSRSVHPGDKDYGRGKLYKGDQPPVLPPWRGYPGGAPKPVAAPSKRAEDARVFTWDILEDGTNVHKFFDSSEQHILPDGRLVYLAPTPDPPYSQKGAKDPLSLKRKKGRWWDGWFITPRPESSIPAVVLICSGITLARRVSTANKRPFMAA